MHTPAAQQRSDARKQLRECERLGEIIVSALIEANHTILYRVLRRNDQYRRLIATLAQRREDIDTIAARQHEIEQQKVEGTLAREKEAFFSGRRNRDFVVLGFKALAQCVRYFLFVLNDQNTHDVLRFE